MIKIIYRGGANYFLMAVGVEKNFRKPQLLANYTRNDWGIVNAEGLSGLLLSTTTLDAPLLLIEVVLAIYFCRQITLLMKKFVWSDKLAEIKMVNFQKKTANQIKFLKYYFKDHKITNF